MTRRRAIIAGGAAAVIAAIVVPITVNSGGSSPSHPATVSGTLTGSVNITCSQGQCFNQYFGFLCDAQHNSTLDLDSLTVDMDDNTPRQAVHLGKGCTGRIGKITIHTSGVSTAVAITGASHIAIGGGTISCDGNVNPAKDHQDGLQVMSGDHIYVTGVTFACVSAPNAQLYVNQVGTSTPSDVVCTGCQFHPDPQQFHDITIGASIRSGVVQSLVCPGSGPNLVYLVGTRAVNPIDAHASSLGNTFPKTGEGGC